jgi:hypothetical protein
MKYVISNESDRTAETFTNKREARKAMTAHKRSGFHFTARVINDHGCMFTGIDAIYYIKG